MKNKGAYHYQCLELANMKGERWESVPGFDGEYEVSNFGRIKSLRRWRATGKSGRGYYSKEIIRRQHERNGYNKFVKEITYTIGITLKHGGVNTSTSTARYVYYAFIEPFDLGDQNILISYKDSDGRNLHYKNLFLTDRSKLLKRTFQLNRTKSPTDKAPVNQYTLEGRLITHYPSITDASKLTGFQLAGIMACMKHNIYQHKGYRWEYANEPVSKTGLPNSGRPVFNEYLWQMLGKPKTSKANPIPALNLSQESMPGEKWKEIEGLGGVYFISNLGRVRSVSRLSAGKLFVWKKGVVKKLFSDNEIGERPSCLLSSFNKKGRKFQLAVGRLVYYHFVQKFSLSDREMLIRYKDGCCYNLNAKNLILAARGV